MNTINYSIENFRKDIYEIVNNSQLPLGTVYFIFKDIFGDITSAYQNAVIQEMQAIQQAELKKAQANEVFETKDTVEE